MPWQAFILGLILVTTAITILEKFTLKREHALQFLTALHFLLVGLALPLLFLVKINLNIQPIFWLWAIFPALTISLASLFFTKSLRHLDVSEVLPMINFSTVFTIIGAFIIFKEHISPLQGLGIGLITFGAYVLEIGQWKNFLRPIKTLFINLASKYQQFLFGAIILYAITYLLDKWCLSQIPIFSYFLIILFYSTLFYLFLTFVFYNGWSDVKKGFEAGGKFILPIAILTLIQILIWFKSITIIPLALLVPSFRLHTLVATLLGSRIFKEKHLFWRLFAATLMIIGGFIVLR